jgi:hypothetical protein
VTIITYVMLKCPAVACYALALPAVVISPTDFDEVMLGSLLTQSDSGELAVTRVRVLAPHHRRLLHWPWRTSVLHPLHRRHRTGPR